MLAERRLILDDKQIAFWEANGYLILRQAIGPAEIAAVLDEVDRQWSERDGNQHEVDILSGEHDGRTFPLEAADPALRRNVYKLNNLFLRMPSIRKVAYSPVIRAALIDLLEGEPLICNSLNFERGSQQPYHLDTWYMPPPVENRMVAANIALEPVDTQNGPFKYYPGSHRITPHGFAERQAAFGDGPVPSEEEDYLNAEIERRGLRPETFDGQAGDVFLWHANLYHGGAPITDPVRTRNSMVVHYWRSGDMPGEKVRRDQSGAYLGHTLRGEITA